MVVWNILIEILVLMFSAVFSFIVCYLVYKRFSVAVWGYVATYIHRVPVAIVAITGGTNLSLFALLNHTLGILIYPVILAVIDILLLEIAFIRFIKPISFILPKGLQTVIKIESFLSVLQEYHAIPRPERVKWVYGAGVIAGIINLMFIAGFGLL